MFNITVLHLNFSEKNNIRFSHKEDKALTSAYMKDISHLYCEVVVFQISMRDD